MRQRQRERGRLRVAGVGEHAADQDDGRAGQPGVERIGRGRAEEALPLLEPDEVPQPMRPVGCPACRQTGYRGRLGLFELLEVDAAVREHLQAEPDLKRLRQVALAGGLQPLRRAGLRLVAQGQTTLDEVLRSTPAWEEGVRSAPAAR